MINVHKNTTLQLRSLNKLMKEFIHLVIWMIKFSNKIMIKYFRRWLFKIEMKLKYCSLIIKVRYFKLWIHSIRISVTKKSHYSKSLTKKYNNYKSSCQKRHQGYWFHYKTKRKYNKSIYKSLFKQEIYSKWFIKCHLYHLNLWNILQIRF